MIKPWIESLLVLQKTDMRIRRLATRLEMLPTEREKLNQDLARTKEGSKDAKEALLKTELDIKQVESEVQKVNAEIQRLQGQSLQVKKNDEYKALMREIKHFEKKISDFETQELMLLDQQDKHKEVLSTFAKNLVAKESSIKEELKELEDLESDLKEEIAAMEEKRKSQLEGIKPGLLSTYQRLLSAGKGEPLSRIHNGNCGHCHLKITPQTVNMARKGEQAFCDNCGRLVYID